MHVLLADDEPKVRAALRLILEQLKEVDVIAEAADVDSLTDCLQHNTPDILLLDWELPGLRPGSSFADLLSRYSQLKVIVLSGRCSTAAIPLASGANAFISKCEPPDRLFDTLRAMGAD